MSTDFEKLAGDGERIAARYINTSDDRGLLSGTITRLAAALREAQWTVTGIHLDAAVEIERLRAELAEARRHAPPPGWCWTELSNGDRCTSSNIVRPREGARWYVLRSDGRVTLGGFDTVQEAVAAFERDKGK